jgi:hypothetical protein
LPLVRSFYGTRHFSVSPRIISLLPKTDELLRPANLTLHEAVSQVTLLGSRGLAGGYRPDSDIDLSLMVDVNKLPREEPDRARVLRSVLDTTLSQWQAVVDVDLAAVFDSGDCCGMRCFNQRNWNDEIISGRGLDCFGIYKTQRGFNGYVTEGVRLDAMYPLLVIWRRS